LDAIARPTKPGPGAPKQPVCADEPFVGNESVDENLEESVRVALWNATGGHCESIDAKVFDGRVVLSGTAPTEESAQRCEEQVRAITGVTAINNLLSWPGSREGA
jgi:osmotically-inducible protein OsmY